MYGDLNEDKLIDAIDLALLKKCILDNNQSIKSADVDGNGSVDAIDFVYMKKFLTGEISSFPASGK